MNSFIRKIVNRIALSLLCLLILTPISQTETVRSNIIQYKLDRLYFSDGQERDIYKGCRFEIKCDGSIICNGLIESSFTGISYGFVDYDSIPDNMLSRCFAFIETAEVDSQATISIGILKDILSVEIGRYPCHTIEKNDSMNNPGFFTNVGNRLIFITYDHFYEMLIDFGNGRLDGFLSYGDNRQKPPVGKIDSAAAPYFAAIIPNLSRPWNRNGFLTTSLYYRFDPDKLPLIFNGMGTLSQNCLYPEENICPKGARYDPQTARFILDQIDPTPDKLTIGIGHHRLKKPGQYYVELLSRDRIRTELSEVGPDADLYLCYFPYLTDEPTAGLKQIIALLNNDAASAGVIIPELVIINDCLELGLSSGLKEAEDYYFGRITESLRRDLGVFSLFRPRLFFRYNKFLKGGKFDKDGLLDLKTLTRIKLPSEEKETGHELHR